MACGAERYWVDLLQRNLRDTSPRESAALLFPRLEGAGTNPSARTAPPRAGRSRRNAPRRSHAGGTHFGGQPFAADTARELRRASLVRRANFSTSVPVGEERDR